MAMQHLRCTDGDKVTQMKIRADLVFDSWWQRDGDQLQIIDGEPDDLVQCGVFDLHAGSVFSGTLEISPDSALGLVRAMNSGYVASFCLMPKKEDSEETPSMELA